MTDANPFDITEPKIDDILSAHGPMSSLLDNAENPDVSVNEPTALSTPPQRPNRETRRARHKKGIGREAIRRQTQERVNVSQRERRARELPEDVKNLIEKITQPEVVARTKDVPLHEWTREDTLNMFFTLAHVHAKMMCPIPADKNDPAPAAVQIIQAGPSVGIFYPVTEDSESHILITVHDPRHYLSGAERDLTNDTALDALSTCAEKMVTGVYSLAGSLLPGSDAHEIADLMAQLDELQS